VLPKGRGRPRFIYKLKTQATQSTASIEIVSLTLQKLKHACRFEKGRIVQRIKKDLLTTNLPLTHQIE